jgi:prevent-host-death family protein
MQQREPVIQTIRASQAREQFSQILNRVFRRESRVLVEKSGIPVAAIVSAADLEQLTQLEQRRAERFKLLGRMREAFADRSEEQIAQEVAAVVDRIREKERPSPSAPRTS